MGSTSAPVSLTAYELALRHVGDDELAQDVTAEAFIFTYKQRHHLTDEKTAEDFLLRIVERCSVKAKTDKDKRDL